MLVEAEASLAPVMPPAQNEPDMAGIVEELQANLFPGQPGNTVGSRTGVRIVSSSVMLGTRAPGQRAAQRLTASASVPVWLVSGSTSQLKPVRVSFTRSLVTSKRAPLGSGLLLRTQNAPPSAWLGSPETPMLQNCEVPQPAALKSTMRVNWSLEITALVDQ